MAPSEPQITSIINTAALWPVDPKIYTLGHQKLEQGPFSYTGLKMGDRDTPDFSMKKGPTLQEQEKEEFDHEQKELAKLGITLRDNHMDGYKYVPPVREVEAASAIHHPWQAEITYVHNAKCTAANWTHTEVLYEIANGVAYITLNRPGHNNAINEAITSGLADAVAELKTRKDVRLVILGANGKMLCAGGDPKGFQDAAAMSDAANRASAVSFAKFLHAFQTLPQFTICCAQGSAMGGGVGFVAMCDMCIAVKSAFFVLSEVKLGVIPATISPYVVAKLGVSTSKRFFCTAENISAEKAKEFGLISEVVDDEAGMKNIVAQIAEKLTACAPEAVASSKNLVMNVANQPLTKALLDYTGAELARVRKTQESGDGMKAIQERRKPFWAETEIKPKK